jgi:hypothetical protein
MRKQKLFLLAAAVAVMGVFAVGCSSNSSNSSSPTQSCQSATSCSKTFQTCCTATQCHYVYNGTTYNCNGTDCTAAAQQLAAAMCGTAKSSAEVQALAQRVLQEATSGNNVVNPR